MKYDVVNGLGELSKIGFGCWALGGHGWGDISINETLYAVDKAIDCGINVFDTAPIYGLGQSEELLGKAVKNKRHDVIIATKCGLRWRKQGGNFRKKPDSSPYNITKELEMSLRRLGTDYIDIYQLHYPDKNTPFEDSFMLLEGYKNVGKIRAIGCSNFTIEMLEVAMKYVTIDVVQLQYNLIDNIYGNTLIPYCKKRGISVLTYSSLADGFLSGHYDATSVFQMTDHRSRPVYLNKLRENLEVIQRVKYIASKLHKTASQVALQWILSNSSVTTALVGMKNELQVKDNVGSCDIELSIDDIKYLEYGK